MVSVEEELLVDETELSEDDEPQNIRYDIMPYPADYTLKGLYEKWQAGQLLIPDFQRNYVWNQTQASRFIESFLLGLPVPQVFLYRDRSDPRVTVIDGQQRLSTVARFYNGELRLKGVNSQWDGMRYDDLSEYDRSELDDTTLRAIIIRQIQPADSSSIYHIFERLNTGGVSLNGMEIRRALCRGEANSLLERLNENPDWRLLIGRKGPDRRFRDLELILRVLALAENWRGYSKPMKDFLTNYMEVIDKADAERIGKLEHRFVKACHIVSTALGEKPFHLRNPLNLAALDSVMACSMELGDSLKSDIGSEYQGLLADETFLEAVTYNTSDAAVVRQRFELVHSAFGS